MTSVGLLVRQLGLRILKTECSVFVARINTLAPTNSGRKVVFFLGCLDLELILRVRQSMSGLCNSNHGSPRMMGLVGDLMILKTILEICSPK